MHTIHQDALLACEGTCHITYQGKPIATLIISQYERGPTAATCHFALELANHDVGCNGIVDIPYEDEVTFANLAAMIINDMRNGTMEMMH